MTDLHPITSPAAQAVLDAFTDSDTIHGLHLMTPRLAAALVAVADQVVPEQGCQIYGLTERENERQQVREEILSIAAELEGQ